MLQSGDFPERLNQQWICSKSVMGNIISGQLLRLLARKSPSNWVCDYVSSKNQTLIPFVVSSPLVSSTQRAPFLVVTGAFGVFLGLDGFVSRRVKGTISSCFVLEE